MLTDGNSDAILSATVTISSGDQPGDVLAMAAQNGITATYATTQTTGTLTIAGDSASVSAFQLALASITITSSGATGVRTVSFSVTDTNDGLTSGVVTKQVNILAPAQVAGVYISSSSWSSSFLSYLGGNGLGSATFGYALQTGATQLNMLPWTTINTISVQFNEPVTIDSSLQSGFGLLIGSSSTTAPANTSGFTYNPTTNTATWTFAAPLSRDKYLMYLPASGVTDSRGAPLDGEFTNWNGTTGSTFPSGADGVANSDFDFRFNLNPGDAAGPTNAADTSVTTVTDLTLVHSHLNQQSTNPSYSPYVDLVGSGTINTINDLTAVHANLNNQLPSAAPTFPAQSTGAESGGIVDNYSVTAAIAPFAAQSASPAAPSSNVTPARINVSVSQATDMALATWMPEAAAKQAPSGTVSVGPRRPPASEVAEMPLNNLAQSSRRVNRRI